MAQHQHTKPLFSQRIGRIVLLILCALVPLVMHTNVYNFALLPKRLVLQFALLIIAIVWIQDLRTKRTSIHTSAFYLPLACYLILAILAITQAVNPLSAMVALSHQITFILLFLLAAHTFPLNALTTFFRISAGVGILVSFIGIFEARGIEGWLPLSNGRPSATFAYRNFAAAFLIMNLPLTIVLVLKARNAIDAYTGILSSTVMFVFLIYTRTRGAWIGLVGASVIIITLAITTHRRSPVTFSQVLRNRTVQLIALIALVLAITLSALPPNIASQQSRAIDEKKAALLDALSFANSPEADRGRWAMWRHTLEIIRDHPLLGIGPGNWRYVYPPYDGGDMIRADSAPERPHNDYLEIASETGVPSLIIYIWFLIAVARVLLRILKTPADPEHTFFALALAASMLAMLGHSLVSFPHERIPTSFLFWFSLGILAQLDPQRRSRPTPSPFFQQAALLIPLLLVLGTYLTYRHIQFDRHYLRAFEFYRGGNMRSVLYESALALQWGPFDTQAFLLKGKGYQAMGQFNNAELSYQEGLSRSPHMLQLIGALGHVYAQTNRFDDAEKCFTRVLALYPKYYEMYNNLGGIYQSRGNVQAAISAYKKVLSYNPKSVETYSNLGLAYVAVDSTAQAIWAHESALNLAPNNPAIYHNIGEAYYRHALKDPTVLPIAQKAFERFLQNWNGPLSDTEKARQRLADIRTRLTP